MGTRIRTFDTIGGSIDSVDSLTVHMKMHIFHSTIHNSSHSCVDY